MARPSMSLKYYYEPGARIGRSIYLGEKWVERNPDNLSNGGPIRMARLKCDCGNEYMVGMRYIRPQNIRKRKSPVCCNRCLNEIKAEFNRTKRKSHDKVFPRVIQESIYELFMSLLDELYRKHHWRKFAKIYRGKAG